MQGICGGVCRPRVTRSLWAQSEDEEDTIQKKFSTTPRYWSPDADLADGGILNFGIRNGSLGVALEHQHPTKAWNTSSYRNFKHQKYLLG